MNTSLITIFASNSKIAGGARKFFLAKKMGIGIAMAGAFLLAACDNQAPNQTSEDGTAFGHHSVKGNLGNWEIVSLGATQRDLPLDRVYREANNRLVEWLYQHGRAAVKGALIPKGPAGARLLLKSIKDGKHLGMLVDQKMNDGISVPFFGRDVMTAPALAELALRYDCPVVPARIERLKGARFKLIVLPPLEMIRTGDHHADVAANMARINAQIEQWIRDTPEQWLWLHNRWPD